jgi:hypothetical protein
MEAAMSLDWLRNAPASSVLVLAGAVCVILGGVEKIAIGKDRSLQMANEYRLPLVIVGAVLVVAGLLELRRPPRPLGLALPVTRVSVTDAEKVVEGNPGASPRARVRGAVEPAIRDVRVWLLREDFAHNPGHFSVEARSAVTDQNGKWEQIVHLWGPAGGRFRVHALVGPPTAEQLFTYYRTAFERARDIYREKVDRNAQGVPGWPTLTGIPADC